MTPESPSQFAANLVVEQSPEVVDRLIGELEHMLERHAAFDRWLSEHSICEVSRRPRQSCRCRLCIEAGSM